MVLESSKGEILSSARPGQVSLTQWCGGWIERIASIYHLNDARLEHYDPGLKRQTPEFDAAQGALTRRSTPCSRTPNGSWPAWRTRRARARRCARWSTIATD